MAGAQRVVSGESIESYFAEIVERAVAERGVDITSEAQFYLVNMLAEFVPTDQLYPEDPEGRRGREALALILARAAEAETAERVRLLKRLGDSSLYISGFFAESLARSLVDVDYYISMGGSAYGELANLLAAIRRRATYADLFAELSAKFEALVEVLALVSEQATIFSSTNASIVRLYELWLRTGSRRAAERLRALGLDPTAVHEPKEQQ